MQTQHQIQSFTHPDFGQLEVIALAGKLHFPATDCVSIKRADSIEPTLF
jgi:prophage antirepressor-like protein